ncbi:MAG: hypothetical protein JWN72_781 [Thermoleophilia bacterium]|nr:hypothetical protein [Thermoleophilia bacterium]
MRFRIRRRQFLLLATAAALILVPSVQAETVTVTPGAPPTGVYPGPTATVSGFASAPGSVRLTTLAASEACPASPPSDERTSGAVVPAGDYSVPVQGLAFVGGERQDSGSTAVIETREANYRLCAYLTTTQYLPAPQPPVERTATAEATAPWAAASCPATPGTFDISYVGVFGGGNTSWIVTAALTSKGLFDAALFSGAVGNMELVSSSNGGKTDAFGRHIEQRGPGTTVVGVSDGWDSTHLSVAAKRPGTKYTLATRFSPNYSGVDFAPCLKDGVATTKPVYETRTTVVIPPLKITAALRSIATGRNVAATAATVLRTGGYEARVHNKAVGVAAITWYAANSAGTSRVPLATGSSRTAATGMTTIKVRLTPAGKRVVRRGTKLITVATFKAAGHPLQSYPGLLSLR